MHTNSMCYLNLAAVVEPLDVVRMASSVGVSVEEIQVQGKEDSSWEILLELNQ